MPFTAEYLNASFGSSRTGIGTVGYTLMKNDGTVSVARTTAGVVEEGGGVYGKANIPILDNSASILWDTGGGTPLYAAEDLEPHRKNAELEAKLPTNYIMGSGVQTDKDDEIDAIDTLTAATLDAAISSRATPAQVKAEADQALVDYDPPTFAEMTGEHAVLSSEHSGISAAIAALNNISIADVQTAMTSQGYTTVRALLLDNLDVLVSSRESTAAAAAREAAILAAIAALNNLSQAQAQAATEAGLTAQGYTTARAPMIELTKKILVNRLELADGSLSNWVLYDDDDSTPLLTWSVVNKNNGAIDIPTAAPAKRDRGA